MGEMIEVKNLKKYYKEVKAVDDVSFKVAQGELFGFLGVNGAGKSTTIKMLCTVLAPTDGRAYIGGYELGKEDEAIRRLLGIVYQENCLDDELTVKENLIMRGHLYGLKGRKFKEQLYNISELLGLDEVMDRRFARLSGGQKRRCEIGRALIHGPEVLFLDEPTTGLDPATRKDVWQCIAHLRQQVQMTVFLTTHYMEEAAGASHIAIMDSGKLKQYNTPFALKEDFAKDSLMIIPKDYHKVSALLEKEALAYTIQEDRICVSIESTLGAIPLIEKVKAHINGFEVIQGTMDDVFLNITGKTLVG